MNDKITITGIIILGIISIALFAGCDITSPFIDDIQEKIDEDTGVGSTVVINIGS